MRLQRTVKATKSDVEEYARITGDYNPMHIDASYADRDETFPDEPIVHGTLITGWFSSLLYSLGDSHDILAEVVLKNIDTSFRRPLPIGDQVAIEAIVPHELSKNDSEITVVLRCYTESNDVIATGTATIIVDRSVDPR